MTIKIGSHVSMANGLEGAVIEALSYNANTLMMYTGAPQNTRRKPVSELKINEGLKLLNDNNIKIEDVVVHAPYIINLASYKEDTWKLATDFLKVEIDRVDEIGCKYLVLHPGAFTDMDKEYGINRIAEGLNKVLTEDQNVIICLETMAGKGTELGRNFEEIASIIEKVTLKDKVMVCADSCHLHDSGYDIVGDLEGVLDEFDKTIGLDRLRVFHINGSLNERGAKKDRHANLGAKDDNPKGSDKIGLLTIQKIVHNPRLTNTIFILETPWLDKTTNLYKEEIEAIRSYE